MSITESYAGGTNVIEPLSSPQVLVVYTFINSDYHRQYPTIPLVYLTPTTVVVQSQHSFQSSTTYSIAN
jgi:hypothetical protein